MKLAKRMEMVDFGPSHEFEVLIEKMALVHNDLIDLGIADPDHLAKSEFRNPAFHRLHEEPMMRRRCAAPGGADMCR